MSLRIIAGDHRGRMLKTPPESLATRPYPARVREALFCSILRGWWEDAKVVDVFCGVGSVGLEAISRGAREAFFVEQDRRVANLLQENIESMDCADRAEVLRADAFSPLVRLRLGQDCDIVSLDPPYAMMQEEGDLGQGAGGCGGLCLCLRPGGWFVLRTPRIPNTLRMTSTDSWVQKCTRMVGTCSSCCTSVPRGQRWGRLNTKPRVISCGR